MRHKAGATFGPDGLSRRPRQEGDPPIEVDNEEAGEPDLPKFEMKEETDPPPLPIEEFVDQIDSRRGYFHGIAKSLNDFSEELEKADMQRDQECKYLQSRLDKAKADLPTEQIKYVQHLVSVLALKSSVPAVSDSVGESFTRARFSRSHDEYREKGILKNATSWKSTSQGVSDNEIHGKDAFYNESHRSVGAIEQDKFMSHVKLWLENHNYIPEGFSDKQKKRLFRLAGRFLIYEGRIYRRGTEGQHRLFVPKQNRVYMMTEAHDRNGHRGFFATRALLSQRFWWPEMECDIKEFVKTCHSCQERQKMLVRIPPTKTHTPSIFEVLHADIMHMSPPSNGCRYIVHGRDGLSSWAEGRALKDEKARSIALWLYEEILCRWGGLCLILTDNGSSFIAAAKWIKEKWGIKHVTISPYNSKANGAVERPHWDIRQMLFKATGAANVKKWYWFLNSVLWADRVSIRKRTGCSPYFMVTGAHPILPLDTVEATWLVKPPSGVMTEIELIGLRARALAKHSTHVAEMRRRIDKDKLKWIQTYERDYRAVIKDFEFAPGDLVLVRNTAIESALDKKMKARYTGPMIVVRRNRGGSYIVADMTGAVWQNKVARFRVIPYFAREKLTLPDGIMSIIDADLETLDLISAQPEEAEPLSRDYLLEDVHISDPDNSDDEVGKNDDFDIDN